MSKVNIILPVYNGGEYINDAVSSILNQTFSDFTLYIINDGSTDNTLDVLNLFTDKRVHILSNDGNKGLIYSLNRGLECSKGGEYIARMDADDISLPNRLEEQVKFLDANLHIGVVGTAVEYFSKNRSHIKIMYRPCDHSKVLSALLFYNPIVHPTVMIRTKVLSDEKYPQDYPKYEDYMFWINLTPKVLFANLNKVLLRYRQHEMSVTHSYSGELEKNLFINEALLTKFCLLWNIDLTKMEIRALSIISYRKRFDLEKPYSAHLLIQILDSILPKLPSQFHKRYFMNIFCERSLLYFIQSREIKELFRFYFTYKYDKSFLIKYIFVGKR
jgi:glycosyltransferase involved in cell wall biosynthesis